MLQPNAARRHPWHSKARVLDFLLSSALRTERINLGLTPTGLQMAYRELHKLLEGGEPDYDMPGVALAYGHKYQARRVFQIGSYLSRIIGADGPPLRVLDIGSGADATSTALQVFFPNRKFEVHCIDNARAMHQFGGSINLPNVSRYPFIMDYMEYLNDIPFDFADAAVLSSVFSYSGWRRPTDFATVIECLTRFLVPGAPIITLEPRAKLQHLIDLQREMVLCGWGPSTLECCHHNTEPLRRAIALKQSTEEVRKAKIDLVGLPDDVARWIGSPQWPVSTWNPDAYEWCLTSSVPA